jgi:hypothetical protein
VARDGEAVIVAVPIDQRVVSGMTLIFRFVSPFTPCLGCIEDELLAARLRAGGGLSPWDAREAVRRSVERCSTWTQNDPAHRREEQVPLASAG